MNSAKSWANYKQQKRFSSNKTTASPFVLSYHFHHGGNTAIRKKAWSLPRSDRSISLRRVDELPRSDRSISLRRVDDWLPTRRSYHDPTGPFRSTVLMSYHDPTGPFRSAVLMIDCFRHCPLVHILCNRYRGLSLLFNGHNPSTFLWTRSIKQSINTNTTLSQLPIWHNR